MANLRPDLRLKLLVGTPDCEYLSCYRNNPYIEIIETSPQEWERFRDCSLHQRAAWNYWRAMTFGISRQHAHGLVVFEDDVLPARNWEHSFHRILEAIEQHASARYVLSLYSPYAFEPHDGLYFTAYPVELFFGAQAIYYAQAVRE